MMRDATGPAGTPLPSDPTPASTRLTPGWRTMLGAAAFYLVCLTVATWPSVPRMASSLPTRVDPLAHLWTMRWNRSCLLEGKLPFSCPDIQYPVGAALGTLPPMHFQTLLYVPLSFLTDNDVLIYNILRLVSFLLTGLGTLVLVWNLTGDRWAATFGGLLAVLSQPMIFFSQAELEQITVGWFPLFLVAWVRWVDRPTARGLAASAVLYLLVAMSAPYFGVFAVFPATLYVAWSWAVTWRSGGGAWGWTTRRLGWFAAFALVTAPGLVLLFSNQIWALRHGFSMTRPDAEFATYRAPLWGYLLPSPLHRLSHLLPFDTNVMMNVGSIPSYLGVVTLGLIAFAALARAPMPRRGFFWAMLVMLVVLSLGAHTRVGPWDIGLPSAWLKKYFIGFRMIRVPARFNLFAAVAAATVAAVGLAHLLRRVRSGRVRGLILGGLTMVTVVDLGWTTYPTVEVPPVPPCYAAIRRIDPTAAIADIPHFNDGAFNLASLATYWQSSHGARTSAGYTAFSNTIQDNLLGYTSPFGAFRMTEPDFLRYPTREAIELQAEVDFRSYVWLYLTAHDIRFVVFHHTAEAFPELPIDPRRFEALLHDSLVYNDRETAVFDRDRMPRPTEPVLVYDRGWTHRVLRRRELTIMLQRDARVLVYNPRADRPVVLTLDAAGHKVARTVVVAADGVDVARWTVPASDPTPLATPPLTLAEGVHELTLRTDGDSKPSRTDVNIAGDKAPFALWVSGIGLEPANPVAIIGRRVADRVSR